MRSALLLPLVVLLIAGCVAQSPRTDGNWIAEHVDLVAADGTKLAADWSPANGTRAVVLIHMLGGSRNDWAAFSQNLTAANWSTLAIDLRGHGDSQGDWRTFSETDFSHMQQDVEAAKQFVRSKGRKDVVLMGASIGANLAIMGAVDAKTPVKGVVAISPGLDYHSLRPEIPAAAMRAPLLLVAAEDDAYSADSSRTLDGMAVNSTLLLYPTGGHGMLLFNWNPKVGKAIMSWLNAMVG